MPGYRALGESFEGAVADRVREAGLLEKDGDLIGALRCYEEALAAYLELQREMPAFLCGRLATLYRRLGLNHEEVALLERYRDSQTSDEARSRFQARLSKAQILAQKKRSAESGALASVRAVREGGSGRARRAARLKAAAAPGADVVAALIEALAQPGASVESPALLAAVAHFCESVKLSSGVDAIIAALKTTLADGRPAAISADEWKTRGSLALQLCVARYFGDDPTSV